jgi:cytochrome b
MLSEMKRNYRFCILGLVLLVEQVQAAQWGVIASTYDTLREFAVVSEASVTETLQEAIQTCRKKRPGQDCFAVAAVQDGCLAWAVDRRGHYGWAQLSGVRHSAEAFAALELKAVEQCLQDPAAGRCRVVRTLCTEDRDL